MKKLMLYIGAVYLVIPAFIGGLFYPGIANAVVAPPSASDQYVWVDWGTIQDTRNSIVYIDPNPNDSTNVFYRQNDPDPNTDPNGSSCTGDFIDTHGSANQGSLTVVSSGVTSSTVAVAPCKKSSPTNISIGNTEFSSAYFQWVDGGTIQNLKDASYAHSVGSGRVVSTFTVTVPANSAFVYDAATKAFIYKSADGCNSSITATIAETTAKIVYRGKQGSSCYESPAQTITLARPTNATLSAGTGTPAGSSGGAAAAGGTQGVCNADSFSWIICPLITLASGTIDKAQSALQVFLNVPPLTTSGDKENPPYIYNAWKAIRNLADIFFVLAFFFVIFGTAFGLNNYTVKKLLPRIIAAAILVQFSFWLAGFIIDTGNVLGYGMKTLFDTVVPTSALSFDFTTPGQKFWASADTVLLVAGAGVAAGIGVVMLTATAVIGAVISILVVIGTLLIRQVIIVMLVILSPIALVLWILPNTERAFQFWYKNLIRVVLLFPLVALLFGSARIFALAAMATAPVGLKVAFGVIGYILPLFLVPATFKMAGSLMNMGAAGVAKLGGAANKQWGAGSERDKRAATRRQLNSSERALAAPDGSLRQRINAKRAGFGFRPTAQNKAAMAGISLKEDKALLEAADRKLETADRGELITAATSQDAHVSRAAIARLAAKGDTRALDEVLTEKFDGDATNREWQRAIGAKSGDLFKSAPHLVQAETDADKRYREMGAEAVAGLSDVGFERWQRVTTGTARQAAMADEILASDRLRFQLTDSRRTTLASYQTNNANPAPAGGAGANAGTAGGRAGGGRQAPSPGPAQPSPAATPTPTANPAPAPAPAPTGSNPSPTQPAPTAGPYPGGGAAPSPTGTAGPYPGPTPAPTTPTPGAVVNPTTRRPSTFGEADELTQQRDETLGDDRSIT